jgi:hypothetical protein
MYFPKADTTNHLSELDLNSMNFDEQQQQNSQHRLINPLDELAIPNPYCNSNSGMNNQRNNIAPQQPMSGVDSLLMHDYSPTYPQQNFPQQQNIPIHTNQTAHFAYHPPQPPQQQQKPTFVVPKQQYRKVRPEPVNEKSIVGSVVGFFQDKVVGGGGGGGSDLMSSGAGMGSTMYERAMGAGSGSSGCLSSEAKRLHHHHHHNQSAMAAGLASASHTAASLANEIKEQIEWLHFENVNMLDSSRNSTGNSTSNIGLNQSSVKPAPFNDANLILVIGYKTGFSVWIIDVRTHFFETITFCAK